MTSILGRFLALRTMTATDTLACTRQRSDVTLLIFTLVVFFGIHTGGSSNIYTGGSPRVHTGGSSHIHAGGSSGIHADGSSGVQTGGSSGIHTGGFSVIHIRGRFLALRTMTVSRSADG